MPNTIQYFRAKWRMEKVLRKFSLNFCVLVQFDARLFSSRAWRCGAGGEFLNFDILSESFAFAFLWNDIFIKVYKWLWWLKAIKSLCRVWDFNVFNKGFFVTWQFDSLGDGVAYIIHCHVNKVSPSCLELEIPPRRCRSVVAFWKYWCRNWVTLDARRL